MERNAAREREKHAANRGRCLTMRGMTTESASPASPASPAEDMGTSSTVLQIYRCPMGHLNKITWTAAEMALASEHNDIKFYCERCGSARLATATESASLVAALGVAPTKRNYSS